MTEDQYLKAKNLLLVKKYDHGLRYIKTLLADSPDNDMLFAFLASNYQGLKRLKEAEKAINEAIKLNPATYSHYKIATKIHLLSENPEKAQKFVQEAIELNPTDPDLFGYQSYAYAVRNKYEKTLECAAVGLSIDPNNTECLKAKALALSFLNKGEEAEAITKKLLASNPMSANNLFADGLVSLIKGKESSSQLFESLKLQPNNQSILRAYRLSLRNELPGFERIQKWISGFGKKDSFQASLFGIPYVVFFFFCFLNFAGDNFDIQLGVSWLIVYLVFWNINLVFQLMFVASIPFYDALLYVSNQKFRDLFSIKQQLTTITVILSTAIATSFFFYGLLYMSIAAYLISLHIGTATLLVLQVSISNQKNPFWNSGYLIVTYGICLFSVYQFDNNIYLFLVLNITFRILSILYPKISLRFASILN